MVAQNVCRLGAPVVSLGDQGVSHTDDVALGGRAPHYFYVLPGVDCAGAAMCQFSKEGRPAGVGERAVPGNRGLEGYRIGHFAALDKRPARGEDFPVHDQGKMFGPKVFANLMERGVVNYDAAEHRLFRFQGVGQRAEDQRAVSVGPGVHAAVLSTSVAGAEKFGQCRAKIG